MIAIILGAGQGTRLQHHTKDRPKCLVELAGKTILERECEALRECGVDEIYAVTGYRSDQIEATGLPTFHNPRFASTNMVASLMAAAELFDGRDDVLISYGDIIYEPRLVQALIECDAPASMVINSDWLSLWKARMDDPLSDVETLKIDDTGNITEIGKKARSYQEIEGQYTGLLKFSADVAPQVVETYRALDPDAKYDGNDLDNMYMTSFLQHWIDHVTPIRAVQVSGGWLEVDTVEDLEIYLELDRLGELDKFCKLSG